MWRNWWLQTVSYSISQDILSQIFDNRTSRYKSKFIRIPDNVIESVDPGEMLQNSANPEMTGLEKSTQYLMHQDE